MDWRSVTKLLRLRRPSATVASDEPSPDVAKLKLGSLKTLFSQPLDPTLSLSLGSAPKSDNERAALESFAADLFAAVSAIKASYAQLQLAQSPYDPDSIQSADQSIVSDLRRISELKQSYLKNQLSTREPHAAQIQELNNLVKTFQITAKKLESELHAKDADLTHLRSKLPSIEAKNRALESKLHPHKTLASLANLHLSALNPTHFLVALRFAVKSIRSFVKLMATEMESAGWDLNAAAAAVHGASLRPEHRSLAFESFVAGKMFSDFHRKDFNFEFLEARSSWSRQEFFDEFSEFKFLSAKEVCDRRAEFGKFCRGKYLSLVHPRMEAAFSGSGRGMSDPGLYGGFMEMAKRVWLLHCLFFSFGSEGSGSVFQARSGSRFSEVYMEGVGDADPTGECPTVGFTVVPGFRVGSTVIQCRVYLA